MQTDMLTQPKIYLNTAVKIEVLKNLQRRDKRNLLMLLKIKLYAYKVGLQKCCSIFVFIRRDLYCVNLYLCF